MDRDQPNKPLEEARSSGQSNNSRLEQLEVIFNSSIDVNFLLAVEPGDAYRFTSVNKAFLTSTGLSREQVEGKYIDDIIPESSRSFAIARYEQAILEKQTIQWEETSVYPAGRRTGIVSVTPVFNDQQECTMLVGTVHDITERKIAEEEKEQARYLLNERVKELTTLYNASQLLRSETKTMEEIIQELLYILPSGWQYPEITEARIVIGEDEYKTPGFVAGSEKQSVGFIIADGRKAVIEIIYTEKKPAGSEGPFLAEERKLINMLAEMLSNYFARKGVTKQVLKEKELSESIINSLPGIFYLQEITGEFIRWNKQFEAVTGYTAEEMSQLHPLDFFNENDKRLLLKKSSEMYANGTADLEAFIITKNGKNIPFYFTGGLVEYEGRPCIIGTGIDITERKKASEQLMKEKELSESIINSLPGIFYLFDDTGRYLRWNKNHETVPGYTNEEMRQMYPLNLFDVDEKELVKERIEKVFAEGYADVEANFMGKDGTKTPYYFNGIKIEYEGKNCLMGVAFDITERKLLQQKIVNQKVQAQKRITRAILNAQERERNKIGQELHDNVNQILAGSKMCLGLVSSANDELIDRSISLIDDAVNEIRSITREHVTPQRKVDLKDIIQNLVDNLNEHSAIKTSFVYDMGTVIIKDDLKLNIYRIIQEGINNILKHTNAKNAVILLKADETDINIMIGDDGNGFEPTSTKSKGIGISNMTNRVESYNGDIQIESSPGNGCNIRVWLPS